MKPVKEGHFARINILNQLAGTAHEVSGIEQLCMMLNTSIASGEWSRENTVAPAVAALGGLVKAFAERVAEDVDDVGYELRQLNERRGRAQEAPTE